MLDQKEETKKNQVTVIEFDFLSAPQNNFSPVYIIHLENEEQVNALIAFANALKIKFEKATERDYDKNFVEKIKLSKSQHEQGNSKGRFMEISYTPEALKESECCKKPIFIRFNPIQKIL